MKAVQVGAYPQRGGVQVAQQAVRIAPALLNEGVDPGRLSKSGQNQAALPRAGGGYQQKRGGTRPATEGPPNGMHGPSSGLRIGARSQSPRIDLFPFTANPSHADTKSAPGAGTRRDASSATLAASTRARYRKRPARGETPSPRTSRRTRASPAPRPRPYSWPSEYGEPDCVRHRKFGYQNPLHLAFGVRDQDRIPCSHAIDSPIAADHRGTAV